MKFPVTPDAPGLFSTTTGCPRRCCSSGARSLAGTSVRPPGANATTRVTGRLGKSSARAMAVGAIAAASAPNNNSTLMAGFLLSLDLSADSAGMSAERSFVRWFSTPGIEIGGRPVAQVQCRLEVNARRQNDIVEEHMIADGVH